MFDVRCALGAAEFLIPPILDTHKELPLRLKTFYLKAGLLLSVYNARWYRKIFQ